MKLKLFIGTHKDEGSGHCGPNVLIDAGLLRGGRCVSKQKRVGQADPADCQQLRTREPGQSGFFVVDLLPPVWPGPDDAENEESAVGCDDGCASGETPGLEAAACTHIAIQHYYPSKRLQLTAGLRRKTNGT